MARLGKYELIEELGRGGYGTVHRARDTMLDVDRAIKILHPLVNSDPQFVQSFRKEARLVARLSHPNIIPVVDFGQAEGRMYLVMEYMPGGNLRQRLVDGGLSFSEAFKVLDQIGSALHYAHEEQIIHRDIKPENILFDGRGNPRLGDFGFARSLSQASTSTSMSLTGGVLGTPAYMAPEAWEGKGWTPAADVYSLACVFVELLSGKTLFEATSPVEAMKKHVIDGPQFPESWPEGTPAGIQRVMSKALEKGVENRYQSVKLFNQAVEELMNSNPSTSEFLNITNGLKKRKSENDLIPQKKSAPQRDSGLERISLGAVMLICVLLSSMYLFATLSWEPPFPYLFLISSLLGGIPFDFFHYRKGRIRTKRAAFGFSLAGILIGNILLVGILTLLEEYFGYF